MALNHAILTALLDRELTGYELAKEFDVSLGFFWQASHQQIYQQLKSLAIDGLLAVTEVPQAGKPDKKLYGITEAGREFLAQWVAGETRRKPARDDLFVKLYNLGSADQAALIAAVQQRLEEHQAKLELYEKIRLRGYQDPSSLSQHRLGMYLALLAGITQEQGFINWCKTALELLQSSTRN
jgi:DNA-binding PadR family transcriptional regulator